MTKRKSKKRSSNLPSKRRLPMSSHKKRSLRWNRRIPLSKRMTKRLRKLWNLRPKRPRSSPLRTNRRPLCCREMRHSLPLRSLMITWVPKPMRRIATHLIPRARWLHPTSPRSRRSSRKSRMSIPSHILLPIRTRQWRSLSELANRPREKHWRSNKRKSVRLVKLNRPIQLIQ